MDFETRLANFAEVIVHFGLHTQPGRKVLINAPLTGTPDIPQFVRLIAEKAYDAGAPLVDVMWSDELLNLTRLRHAPEGSLTEFSKSYFDAIYENASNGDSYLRIVGQDPDLLANEDPDAVMTIQRTAMQQMKPISHKMNNELSGTWSIIAVPVKSWADKVLPDLPEDQRIPALWDLIFSICRADQADPISAWQAHSQNLTARYQYLNEKQYTALHYTAPGTDLTLGMPENHRWLGGGATNKDDIFYLPNIPTEEVFCAPHREKAHGVVSSSMPLNYNGTLIENFSLTLEDGKVVKVTAEKGEVVLKKMIDTDEGAGHFGEVALVPHSSPISQSGRIFYNTLFDENASCHLALGRAYAINVAGGTKMSEEELTAAGLNTSLVHTDFMIGSGAMNIDGTTADGQTEPIMRNGEWAFSV
ncbi:MAG: aminopeptidase [Aggregatilineales bacterium]